MTSPEVTPAQPRNDITRPDRPSGRGAPVTVGDLVRAGLLHAGDRLTLTGASDRVGAGVNAVERYRGPVLLTELCGQLSEPSGDRPTATVSDLITAGLLHAGDRLTSTEASGRAGANLNAVERPRGPVQLSELCDQFLGHGTVSGAR